MQGMIVSLEPKEFVSCGQLACCQHPGLLCLHFHQSKNLGSSQSTLLGTFSQVTLDDKSQNEESLKLRMCDGLEEELYLSGSTVIWSRGHVVLKTFTVDTPVKQAVWCKFLVDGEDPHQFDLPKLKGQSSIQGVSIVADGAVHVYSEDGDNYVTALPFQVRDVWCFKYGLLLERLQSKDSSKPSQSIFPGNSMCENDLTTIFCLQHPLREFSPVIMKNQGSVRYMNKANDMVVYCKDDFVMTCDQRHGLHTVWKARQVSSDDVNSLQSSKPQQLYQISSLCHMSMSSPGLSPYRGGICRGSPGYTSSNVGTSYLHTTGLNKTPQNNRNPSLAHLSHTPQSSRAFSPSAGSMLFQSNTFSPLRHSPHLTRSPCTPLSHESLCLNNSIHESAEPLRPELCFDHMWTESLSGTREGLSIGKATKAFQTKDLCNQSYLVYHIDSLSQLRVVRYTTSNDMSHLIFGAVTCMCARDAAPLVNLNMYALLDLNGCLFLYSGYFKVVKMNLSGLPLASLSLSHGLRSNASVPATPQPISTPAHPSRPTSAMANLDEVGMLSPVPELAYSGSDISILTGDEFAFSTYTSKLAGIPHVVGSTLVLEVASGKLYRVTVPSLCSSDLVKMCLKALRYTLPNDTYLTFAMKWYSSRHSPGALNGQKAEWSLFVDCIMEYLGYVGLGLPSIKATGFGESMEFDVSASPVIAAKKSKPTESADAKDWEYLLGTSYHQHTSRKFNEGSDTLENILSYQTGSLTQSITKRKSMDGSLLGETSHLSSHLTTSVFSCLHLVYEEQKLSTLTWSNVKLMSPLLFRLAKDLNQTRFMYSYTLDNPNFIQHYLAARPNDNPLFSADEELDLKLPGSFSPTLIPSLFENINDLVCHGNIKCPFPYIPSVTIKTERILKIYDCLFNKSATPSSTVFTPLVKTAFNISQCCDAGSTSDKFLKQSDISPAQRVLSYMVSVGIDRNELMMWPQGVALAVDNALRKCSANPNLSFPPAALALLGRCDLLAQLQPDAGDWQHAKLCPSTDPMRFAWEDQQNEIDHHHHEEDEELINLLQVDESGSLDDLAGSQKLSVLTDDNVTRLLFPTDHRMADAHNLLQSTKPSKILLVQQAGVDDREYMEQKQYRLLQLLNRTMALSVGRGMLHLRSQQPSTIESLTVPSLDLTGKDTNNSTITLVNSDIEPPSEITDWPYFHNEVAAALALQSENKGSLVNLSKTSSSQNLNDKAADPSSDHAAGVLFGLGLNHHLQELQTLNIHDYLQKIHELTTIGLLLGLATDRCGSCDLSTMRVLSVHIPALLPATSTQLDIPFRVQTAAVSAVGFLYLGSTQRLVAEVMLREIDRSPNSDGEVCTEREAYALSAGFALGMVTLGRGNGMSELSDLNMSDKLYHFMTGKHKRNGRIASHLTHEAYSPGHNVACHGEHQILEGDHVNTEVTGPGATMALALMYLKTNNSAVADWFVPPNTFNMLETIKPQQLLLRTLSRSLILWDYTAPTVEWVASHVPSVVSSHLNESGQAQSNEADDSEVDEHTVLQCHASIIAGACLALGLRFAGSQEKGAYDTLLHYVNFFLSLLKQPQSGNPMHPLEVIGRRLFDTCLSSCLIALCMVVAGSGNLKALQICRYLHYSLDGDINYGTQMAIHMGLGFLFLGKCRYTLSTSNRSIAALLVSIYPCFPAKSYDNRYHLQALRHMYVVAAEKRLLVPIDVSRKRPCYARVAVHYLPTSRCKDTTVAMVAPCLLPEATMLSSVSMDDQRYLPMSVDVRKQPDKLLTMLESGMYVQLKPGCLSYLQDPKGYCSFLSYPKKSDKGSWVFAKPSILKGKLPKLLAQVSQTAENNSLSHIIELLEDIQNPSLYFVLLSFLETCYLAENSCPFDTLSMWQLRIGMSTAKVMLDQDDESRKAEKLLKVVAMKLAGKFEKVHSEYFPLIQSILYGKSEETAVTVPAVYSETSHMHDVACSLIYQATPFLHGAKANYTLKDKGMLPTLELLNKMKKTLPIGFALNLCQSNKL